MTTMKDLPTDIMTEIASSLKHDPVYKIEYNSVENSLECDTDDGDERYYINSHSRRCCEVLIQLFPDGDDAEILAGELHSPNNVPRNFMDVFFKCEVLLPSRIKTYNGLECVAVNTIDWLTEQRFIIDDDSDIRMVHIKKIERIA